MILSYGMSQKRNRRNTMYQFREANAGRERRRGLYSGPARVLPIAVLTLIKDKPAHGGEIFQSLKDKFGIEAARPVIYLLLRRMERHGLMISAWDIQESGPARRRYTITEDGLAHLNDGIERLKKASKTIKLLIGEKP